jgi:pentatricopeptide repeat protein
VTPSPRRQRAHSICGDPQRVGLDRVTYGTLISACKRPAWWATGLMLLDEMELTGKPAGARELTLLINVCTEARMADLATQLLKRLDSPDQVAYNSTIAACASEGKWQEALALISEMKRKGELLETTRRFLSRPDQN